MTENKAIKESAVLLDKIILRNELILFLYNGGRISFKKCDLGKYYHINDGRYDEIFNDNFEYILEYGITNDTPSLEHYQSLGISEEKWKKEFDKNFSFELYCLHQPNHGFSLTKGKQLILGIEEICDFLIKKDIPLKKLIVDEEELKLQEIYNKKDIIIKSLEGIFQVINTYKFENNIIFAIKGYYGNFLINSADIEIKEIK